MVTPSAQSYPTIAQGNWDLQRKGIADRDRHNAKVKDAIKKNLPDIISEQSIIGSDGKKVIRVPIRSLDEPRFRFGDEGEKGIGQGQGGTKKGDVVGQGPSQPGTSPGQGAGDQPGIDYYEAEFTLDELTALIFEDLGLPNLEEKRLQTVSSPTIRFNDVRKTGAMANIDKRRTIIENLKRNGMKGDAHIGNINRDDLRFKSWEETFERQSGAVIFAMMDVSGSMGNTEKYIARAFYYWMLVFLRTKYQNVEVVFIAHHTEAKEVTEDEFFTKGESGGTMCSSAFKLALEILETRYRPEDWNIYPFLFSDGDNWGGDNEICKELVTKLLMVSALVGYGEIKHSWGSWGGYGSAGGLATTLRTISHPKLSVLEVKSRADVYPALRKFFGPQADPEPVSQNAAA